MPYIYDREPLMPEVKLMTPWADSVNSMYAALHACHETEHWPVDHPEDMTVEDKEKALVRLALGKRGHYSVVENFGGMLHVITKVPVFVASQVRTHRVAISFAHQSHRLPNKMFLVAGHLLSEQAVEALPTELQALGAVIWEDNIDIWKLFHKPEHIHASEISRLELNLEQQLIDYYKLMREAAEREQISIIDPRMKAHSEVARTVLSDSRYTVCAWAFNPRSLMHVLDLRGAKNAQGPTKQVADALFDIFKEWHPAIAADYESNRYGRNKLSP